MTRSEAEVADGSRASTIMISTNRPPHGPTRPAPESDLGSLTAIPGLVRDRRHRAIGPVAEARSGSSVSPGGKRDGQCPILGRAVTKVETDRVLT